MRSRIFVWMLLAMALVVWPVAPSLSGGFAVLELRQRQPAALTIVAAAPDVAPRRYVLTIILPDSLAEQDITAPADVSCTTLHMAHWQQLCVFDLDRTQPVTVTMQMLLRPCVLDATATVRVYLVPDGTFDITMREWTVPIADRSFCARLPIVAR